MEEHKLPKWLERRYSILWDAFESSVFRIDDATKVLEERVMDNKEQTTAVLSELKKSGWVDVRADPEDARKRLYQLKSRREMVASALSVGDKPLTRGEIDAILKKAADLIRTRVDYSFILVLLFYKRISDKWEMEYEQAYRESLMDGLTEEEAKLEAKDARYHDFDLPEEFLWENIRKDTSRLPERFSLALKTIAERNPDLKDAFESFDFIQFTSDPENIEVLRQLVELFSSKSLNHVSADILGDAYEWILYYFAPQKAKEGEVYTPREVIRLLVEMLDPEPEKSVYDPACGSGGMLIGAHAHVKREYGEDAAQRLFLSGQEANHKTLALAKMNLYIHDIQNATLEYGDTLLYPKFKQAGGEGIELFDFVIANPPWNQDGYPEETLKRGEFWKKRYRYGFTNKQSADWAWIQHMLASAKPTGKVGVVIDNGALFRGGKERAIRKRVLEDDLIECVILLPEKIFYNTGAPGGIIVLNKNKPAERKGKVLFINASDQYEKHPDVRKLNRLSDENIRAIVNAYSTFGEGDGFSRVVSLEEIASNDHSLNVTLYVFAEEEREEIDISREWAELGRVEEELKEVEERIAGYLEEMRYGGK